MVVPFEDNTSQNRTLPMRFPGKDLERMFVDPEFGDIELVPSDSEDGHGFHASVEVLKTNCPYFAVTKNIEAVEDGKIKLNVRGKVLAEIRRWIYLRKVQLDGLNPEDYYDLIKASHKYGLEELKEVAVKALVEIEIISSNLVDLFEYSRKMKLDVLTTRCLDYGTKNVHIIIKNMDVFKSLPLDFLLAIKKYVKLETVDGFFPAIAEWTEGRQDQEVDTILEHLDWSVVSTEIFACAMRKIVLKNLSRDGIKDLILYMKNFKAKKETSINWKALFSLAIIIILVLITMFVVFSHKRQSPACFPPRSPACPNPFARENLESVCPKIFPRNR